MERKTPQTTNERLALFACRAAVFLAWLVPLSPLLAADPPNARWAIFIMNTDGSHMRRVVFIDAFPRLAAPRWSHDGKRLAFEAHGQQPGRALLVDTTGRNLIDLGRGARPDWSPDDKQVISEVPGVGRSGVWVQNTDGKGSSWLASGSAPRWSPDGSRIALGAPLRVFDVVSGEVQNVFAAGDDVDETLGCDWSPDGKQLAAVVKRGNVRELVLQGAEPQSGAPRVRLRGRLDGAPAWSPDGKQLAVTLDGPRPGARRIHVLAVAGDDPPTPIPGQLGDNCDPAWSPDGSQLAFASTRRP
jgi:Tol biopolymer transport system component